MRGKNKMGIGLVGRHLTAGREQMRLDIQDMDMQQVRVQMWLRMRSSQGRLWGQERRKQGSRTGRSRRRTAERTARLGFASSVFREPEAADTAGSMRRTLGLLLQASVDNQGWLRPCCFSNKTKVDRISRPSPDTISFSDNLACTSK